MIDYVAYLCVTCSKAADVIMTCLYYGEKSNEIYLCATCMKPGPQ